MLSFQLLGPLRAVCGGKDLMLGWPRQQAVLAALLLRAGGVVSRDELVDAVWGADSPATAANVVHAYIAGLRKVLEPNRPSRAPCRLLVSAGPGYALRLADGQVDLHLAEQHLKSARQAQANGDLRARAAALDAALALWRGTPLAGIPGPLADIERARLTEWRLAALEDRAETLLSLGRPVDLVGELAALLAEHPFRERLAGLLMRALYHGGRQAEALEIYRRTRTCLAQELGIEPGPKLQDLHAQILALDPVLSMPVGPVSRSDCPPTATVPRQLPADTAAFAGRSRELARLTAALDSTGRARVGPMVISAIHGMGGIGKSALAIRAAHLVTDAGEFPDGQVYVNLHGATSGLSPLEPRDALGRMLRALGVRPGQIPDQVEDAAALFRSVTAGLRLLVVLDDALNAEQVRPLLPAGPGCGVLITSRHVLATLDGAEMVHLDVLPERTAIELLGRIAGRPEVAADPQAAAQVVRYCGHLPLAIRIAAARLAARPAWLVSDLAGRLADGTARLAELSAGELGVAASFDVSVQALQHSASQLDQAAAMAFGLLALPEGPDLGPAAAARLLGKTEPDAEAVLECLVDAQLLQAHRGGRYRFHDLLRLCARQHAAGYPENDRLAALSRLFGFYTATAWNTLALLRPGDHRLATADPRWAEGGQQFDSTAAALAWLETERANLLAAVSQAAVTPAISAGLVGQLTQALYGFFLLRNYWRDGAQVNEMALTLARRTGDQAAVARACSDLGLFYLWLGCHQEAIRCQQESLRIYRQLGDQHGQARCLCRLGGEYSRLGRNQQALDYLHESLAIFREASYHRGQGIVLGLLGNTYEALGRNQQALDYLQQSLAVYRALGDRHMQAYSMSDLGRLHRRLGRYQEAVRCHHKSLAVFRDIGDRHSQAEVLRDLGDAYRELGQPEQARRVWHEALEICLTLRAPEISEISTRLDALPDGNQAAVASSATDR